MQKTFRAVISRTRAQSIVVMAMRVKCDLSKISSRSNTMMIKYKVLRMKNKRRNKMKGKKMKIKRDPSTRITLMTPMICLSPPLSTSTSAR